jgi:organic radical activating enzyme
MKFLFDQAKGESMTDEPQNYCQKCKRESKWCPHRKQREVFKQKLDATITTYEANHIIKSFIGRNNTGGEKTSTHSILEIAELLCARGTSITLVTSADRL